jgi:CheY-like chemotaxis protein
LLRSWGCRVVTADSATEAAEQLDGERPDLIMSDYHLANGRKGTDEIEELRAVFEMAIPAFLISGDTAPDQLRLARASGYHLLHKPLRPMALRSIVTQLLKGKSATVDAASELTNG